MCVVSDYLLADTILTPGILIISWHRPGFFQGETLRQDTPAFTG